MAISHWVYQIGQTLWANACFLATYPLKGRGFSKLLSVVPAKGVGTRWFDDVPFRYPIDDPYWARLRSEFYVYEPEMGRFIEAFLKSGAGFIDGGANIGIWSTFAASKGAACVTAVEPNPLAFDWLKLNMAPFPNALLVQGALTSQSDEAVPFNVPETNPAGAHVGRAHNDKGFFVSSADLDSLISATLDQCDRVLVKLDIEGLEASVIGNSEFLGSQEVSWVYEDHGSDSNHRPTRAFLDAGGYTLQYLGDSFSKGQEIAKLQQLDVIKRVSHRGYNFAATPNPLI